MNHIFAMKNNSELAALKRDKRKALGKADIKLAVEICHRIGILLSEHEQYEESAEAHEEELQLAEALGNKSDQAIAHRLIGETLCEIGRFNEALDHHNRYLKLSESMCNTVETQRAWATLGRTHYKIHCSEAKDGEDKIKSESLSNAHMSYFKALEMAEEVKGEIPASEYAEMKARLLLNLGLIYDQKQCIAKCAGSIRQAFFLCKKFGLQEDLHRCQFCLATVYQNHGQMTSAMRIIDEAIVSAKLLKNKNFLSDSLLSKAHMLLILGDYNGSKVYASKALRFGGPSTKEEITKFLRVAVGICKSEKRMTVCDVEERFELMEKVADAFASVGCNDQAVAYYLKMLELAKELEKADEDLAPIYSSLAQTYDDLKDYGRAIEFYEKELECRRNNLRERCKTLLLIADVQDKQQVIDVDSIRVTYVKALKIAVEDGSVFLQKRCLEEQKAFLEAHDMHQEAEMIGHEIGDLPLQDSGECSSEECSGNPFDDVSLGDLTDCSDSDEEERSAKTQKRPQRKKAVTVKKNEKGETPLHRACINGNLKAVRRYLENGHPVNPRDNCGWLPIHEAANYGHAQIVKQLLEYGAWKDDRGGELCNGITPMHDAAVGGHFEVLETLVSCEASVMAVNSSGDTPLDCLIEWRRQNESEMEAGDLDRCQKLEARMKDLVQRQGHEYIEKARPSECSVGGWISSDEEIVTDPSPVVRCNDQDSIFLDEEEELDESFVCPLMEVEKDWDDPEVARESYRDAMLGVKKKTSALKEDVPKPGNIPALIEEDVRIVDDWLIDDVREQKTKRPRKEEGFTSARKKTKRMKQAKLVMMPLETEIRHKMEGNDVLTESRSEETHSSEAVSSDSSTTQLFSVKVRIEKKDILVPISDTSLTFGWLAEEAANRYYTLVGRKPTLMLSRKDGAVFTSSDIICSLLKNSAEIVAVVMGWEHQPLKERYASACAALKTLHISELDVSLPLVEESGVLSLSNVGSLGQCALKPLYRALTFQSTVRCLSLKGVLLNNDTAACLATAIATLPSLSRLSLDCCGLQATHLQMFIDVFGKEFSPTALEELDLSNNLLGEGCSELLAKLLVFFPTLHFLKLSFCGLTPFTFRNKLLREKLHSLQQVDVSSNRVGVRGVSDLLSCLGVVRHLDLSRTQFESGMAGALVPFVTGCLQTLILSGCCLSNDDLTAIARALEPCRSLQELDISANPKATGVQGVILLMRTLDENELPLVRLRMEGSFVWKNDSASILTEYLRKKSLRRCSLTADSEARDVIVGSWVSIWGQSSVVNRRLNSSLELGVVGS